METVNLKQLAEILKLSVSTVSKAFSDSYEISAETKARILAAAKELNYQPNASASSLRSQKTKTIAVILPEIANNFFSLAIKGIESIAQEGGYHVLIYLTHEDPAKEKAFTRLLQKGRVDGILMSLSGGTADLAHIEELETKEIPIVFFDRIYEQTKRSTVTTNDFESSFRATRHLAAQGCRRIMHLSFSNETSITGRRTKGYLAAVEEAGLEPLQCLQLPGGAGNEEYTDKIAEAFSRHKPDGIFSAYEKLAMLTYDVCIRKGLSIPGDVRLATFSNLEIAGLLNPSLTTITQPAFEIGKKAAAMLFEELKGKKGVKQEQVMIESTLHIRRSSE